MNVQKCPRCKEKYVTTKSRYFFKKEELTGDPVCLYCLAEITGKRIGSTGMLETDQPTEGVTVTTMQVSKSVKGCRPCFQRRRAFN